MVLHFMVFAFIGSKGRALGLVGNLGNLVVYEHRMYHTLGMGFMS